jgi:hypothetical protein
MKSMAPASAATTLSSESCLSVCPEATVWQCRAGEQVSFRAQRSHGACPHLCGAGVLQCAHIAQCMGPSAASL